MRLCHLDDLPDGGARGFAWPGVGEASRSARPAFFIVRQGQALHAWRDACPHHGTPLAWRQDAYLNARRDRIVCGAHGAQFEIDTGLCTLGPCLGDRLSPLPLTLNAQGEVFLAAAPHTPQEKTP